MPGLFSDLYKSNVPVNIRMLLDYAMGERSPITEKDFSPEELASLRDAIATRMQYNDQREAEIRSNLKKTKEEYNKKPYEDLVEYKPGYFDKRPISYEDYKSMLKQQLKSFEDSRGRVSFDYGDYKVKTGYRTAPINQGWISSLMQSLNDPAFRMSSTLGSAKYRADKGSPYVEDTYGFSKDHPVYRNTDASNLDIIKRYWSTPAALAEILIDKNMPKTPRREVKIKLDPIGYQSIYENPLEPSIK